MITNAAKKVYGLINSLINDETTYYAASLSFFTIFSLLPILALIIVVVSSIEVFTSYLDLFLKYIIDNLNPAHSKTVENSIRNFLSNADKLGSIGIFYMLFVFTMFFKDYEYIVNKIHGTKRRPLYYSIILYLFFLIILPLLFVAFIIILSLYNNAFFNNGVTFLFVWIFLFIVFNISVNKKINYKASLSASFLTILTLSITKNLFVFYVVTNKTYQTIYGSFSTLLFFFLWIYVSWIIFLYGMKICHYLDKD